MIKLVNIFNIILEGAYDAQGVGDKAYEKFYIPTDQENLKAMAELQRQENGKPVGRIKGAYIFLNPKSLKYFGKNTRAVADHNGNIYVAQRDGEFNHSDIAVSVGFDIEGRSDKFLRLNRLRNGNAFYDVSSYWDSDEQSTAIRNLRRRHPNIQILSSAG